MLGRLYIVKTLPWTDFMSKSVHAVEFLFGLPRWEARYTHMARYNSNQAVYGMHEPDIYCLGVVDKVDFDRFIALTEPKLLYLGVRFDFVPVYHD